MNKEIREDGIYYTEEDRILMKVCFIKEDDNIIINKTFVDDSLRGQGKASFLMKEIITYAKEKHYHIKATCSYARSYFEKRPDEIYIDDPKLKESCAL